MRVLVTGGTGFLGGHVVAALSGAGHDVRVLARSAARMDPVLALHGLGADDVEVVVGDMTDAASVTRAVDRCDAVVHGAAVYSLDPRDAEVMLATNAAGTRTVLSAALDAGAARAIHVSSLAALMVRRPGTRITASAPVGDTTGPYNRSKQASDQVARDLRASGAPVLRLLPGAIIGPADPHDNETNASVRSALRMRPPLWGRETFAYCDVRDCAALALALVEGRGDERDAWMPPMANVNAVDVLARVTGRRLPMVRMSSALAFTAMKPLDAAIARAPRSVPSLPVAGLESFACANVFDDEAAFAEAGVTRTPIDESFRDTVRWLHARGEVTATQAGAALG
jgi:nucleoside-diphosphate-sugar epimerase